jgi:endonuclease/exonuclease/phosphatase family metal-dependent hydrolase
LIERSAPVASMLNRKMAHFSGLPVAASLSLMIIALLQGCGAKGPSQSSILEANESSSDFTVVSYNVENLFDQTDDLVNSYYNQYRIKRNRKGYFSNYDEPINYNGEQMSFTDVKIRGIIKTIKGIKVSGPEIACFQEIESEESMAILFEEAKHLGYTEYSFSDWTGHGAKEMSINLGCLSKYEITDISPIFIPSGYNQRPVLLMTVQINGNLFTVLNNHWRSKAAPESSRLDAGIALAEEISGWHVEEDYVILGDLNSAYNENVVMSDSHNDTDGKTGMNDGLKAGDDKGKVADGGADAGHYNLVHEVKASMRGTAYHGHWNNFDHLIVGPSAFDGEGIDYDDGSFKIAEYVNKKLKHLFDGNKRPNRWEMSRISTLETKHKVGGYSDHLPVYAKFKIK